MKFKLLAVAAVGTFAWLGAAEPVHAQTKTERAAEMTPTSARGKTRIYRRKGTRVYGYSARRGGYSYDYSDVTNTYGLSRSLFGSMNAWRDPSLDRQTNSGPFDHDFFFDSGIGPRGGNAPMLH